MIGCVVFDFDGTLVDSNRIKRAAFFEIAKAFADGPAIMQAILDRADAGDRYWVFEQFVSHLPSCNSARELADQYTRFCDDRITEAQEIPGVSSALSLLRRAGKSLYVNSATPLRPLQSVIHRRGMEHWFDGIYGAPTSKSDNLAAISAVCGVPYGEMLMVGDGETDRAAAEGFGCHFLGIRNPDNNFLRRPVHLVDDLHSLPAYVLGLPAGIALRCGLG